MATVLRSLRCLLSLGLAFALSLSAFGAPKAVAPEAPLPAVWTLPAALDRAMQSNSEIVSARLEVEREEGARWQVRARMLPRVSATASTDERDTSLIDRSPTEFNQPPSQRSAVAKWGYDVRVEVRQMVFDGLVTSNLVERQRLRREQAALRITAVANEVVTAVRQSYDAVLVRRAQLAAETQRVADLSQLADYAARKQALGEIAELDSLNARSLLETARAEQADIEREVTLAEQQFARLLQLPESSGPIVLEGEFAVRTFEMEYSTAAALAFKRRPDLESATLAVESSRRQLKALKGDMLPRFDAFASWSNRSSYYDSSRTLDGWTIGATGNWSLFDGGDSRGRRRAALAEQRIAEVKLDELELQIGSRLRELYQTLAQTRKTMAAQENGRQFATRAFQAARRLYENGQASLEKVLQAQMISRQADNRYLEAVFRYNLTVAQIEQSIGGAVTP
jgi:hypothetical protein